MKFGFARLDITPPLGTNISGYFNPRIADGITDPLQAHAVAFSDGERIAAAVSVDVIGIRQPEMDIIRKRAAEKNNMDYESLFFACTHTHTGPDVTGPWKNEVYNEYLFNRLSDVVSLAIADLKESKVEIARGKAENIAFVRRYKMKDGTTATNPGFLNPDIIEPIGTPDETVQLVKIIREDAADIAIVNFQVHPDVIGGNKFCSDYPGYVRRILEGALKDEKDGKGVHVVYFNGAQGDTNHHNVFLGRRSGLTHSEHMGRVIAGAVLSIYSYTEPIEVDKVRYGQKSVRVPSNKGTAEEVAAAKIARKVFDEEGGEAFRKAYPTPMYLGTVNRLIRNENAEDSYELYLTCVSFGEIAFAGLPGEPFTEIGRQIKAQSPFTMTIPCCCANGYQGYYPTEDAYTGSGYEAGSSNFKAGVAEALIETSVSLVKEVKNS